MEDTGRRCQKSAPLVSGAPDRSSRQLPLCHWWCTRWSCSGADPGPFSVLLGNQPAQRSPCPSPTLAELLDNLLPLSCTGVPWSASPDGICCLRRPMAVGQALTPSETRSHLGNDAVTRPAAHGRPALASLILTQSLYSYPSDPWHRHDPAYRCATRGQETLSGTVSSSAVSLSANTTHPEFLVQVFEFNHKENRAMLGMYLPGPKITRNCSWTN